MDLKCLDENNRCTGYVFGDYMHLKSSIAKATYLCMADFL